MLRFRWLVFGALALAYFLVYFHRLSLSVVAGDLVRDFQTTASAVGILGSVYFYCYALMQLPAGLLSDSIGPRKSVTVFLTIAALGSILFGFAPNLEVAIIGRVMVGLGVSMVFIPTMKILSQWFRAREFALMAGILNAVGGAAVLAATWLLAWMTFLWGWRLSFELIGVLTFGVVAMAWLVVRDRPVDMGLPTVAEIDHYETGPVPPPQEIPLLQGVRRVASEIYFWPLAIWFFFDCGVFFGFGALWGGPYLMHVYGMDRGEAGAVLSMIAWGMIVGSPLLGIVSDRVVKSRKKVIMACSAVLSVEMILLCLFPSDLPRPLLYLAFFVLSTTASSVVVVGFTTAKELFPIEIAGTSVGSVNLFPFLGGAVFMPVLGAVLDAYPKSGPTTYSLEAYSTVLVILAAASLVCLACTFFMKETFPRTEAKT
jgi:sugar phosphate permease